MRNQQSSDLILETAKILMGFDVSGSSRVDGLLMNIFMVMRL